MYREYTNYTRASMVRWKKQSRTKALRKTAEKFQIKPEEVKELLALASEYVQDQIKSIDLEGDLMSIPNRIQIPALGGYFAVKKIHILESMYKNGHITKDQWERIVLTKYRKIQHEKLVEGIKRFNQKIIENGQSNR